MRFATLLLTALLLTPTLRAQANPAGGDCALGTASAELNAANVRAKLFNKGNLFFDGGGNQYEIPKGSSLASIFASAFWLGGVVNEEVRVAGATYAQGSDYEFWPGPLGPGGAAPTVESCAAADRIWRVTVGDVAVYNATGVATPDLAEWPADLGAPVVDGDGDPSTYDLAAGDRPAILGGETAWWVMNDRGGLHTSLGSNPDNTPGPPLGVEMRVTAFTFPAAYTVDRFGSAATGAAAPLALQTFYRVEIRNGNTRDAIDSLSFAQWVDIDLGSFEDDYVGSNPSRNLAYAYNSDDFDGGSSGYGDRPPALGSVYLNTPMAGFVYYNGDDSNIGEFSGRVETYNYLDGRLLDGQLRTEGFNGTNPNQPGTPFMYSAAPPNYWSEFDIDPADGAQPNEAGDRRHISYARRDRLAPGATWTVDLAILWTQADGGALASLDQLFLETDRTQGIYDTAGLFTPDRRLQTLLPAGSQTGEPTFPSALGLGQRPRPHPVVPGTVLDVAVPEGVVASVEVFDALGRLIASLPLVAGQETVPLGTLDLAPGSYLARLRADAQVDTRVVQFIVAR